jgi:predicted acyl esterase
MIEERDLRIRMRDGVRLAVDVYRPDGRGSFPVLYAAALHNKDLRGPDMADVLPAQPANVPLWFGPIEAGDTRRLIGIMDEPPVRYWLMGANNWRTGADWPLPETQWRRLYLSDWERLTPNPPRPAGETGRAGREPDVFTQMPLKKAMKVERLRYVTEPLAEDLTVVGPISLT